MHKYTYIVLVCSHRLIATSSNGMGRERILRIVYIYVRYVNVYIYISCNRLFRRAYAYIDIVDA